MNKLNKAGKASVCIMLFFMGYALGDLFPISGVKIESNVAGYNKDGQELIKCPNNYAIKVREGYEFAGGYIKCEDFDPFYEALAEGRVLAAEKLLLIKP